MKTYEITFAPVAESTVRIRGASLAEAQLVACQIEGRTRGQIKTWRVVPTTRQIRRTISLLRGI